MYLTFVYYFLHFLHLLLSPPFPQKNFTAAVTQVIATVKILACQRLVLSTTQWPAMASLEMLVCQEAKLFHLLSKFSTGFEFHNLLSGNCDLLLGGGVDAFTGSLLLH